LPVVSEPKQIERSRATTAAAFAVRLVGRFREPHQTSFLGMKLQTVFAEPLRQYLHQPLRVTLHRARDHKVVGIAHQKRLFSKHWFCHALEPCVENVMEIDVRQKW